MISRSYELMTNLPYNSQKMTRRGDKNGFSQQEAIFDGIKR
jgi:hypothetical protein